MFVIEGGEPTLRRDLPELLEHIERYSGVSILATNAMSPPWRFGATAFTVSVDGPEDLHDAVRGIGSYQRLQRSLAARDSRSVVAIVVVSRRNRHKIRETLDGIRQSVDGVLFTFEYPYQNVVTNALSRTELVETKREILALKSDFNILNPRSRLLADSGSLPCHDWLTTSVDYEGHIKPGCFVQHVEPRRCTDCELGCFQVISSFYELQVEAWLQFSRLLLKSTARESRGAKLALNPTSRRSWPRQHSRLGRG